MRFDGRESKRGVTIDGPMGRSKYRGTQGITNMDVVKAEADALKQSNEATSSSSQDRPQRLSAGITLDGSISITDSDTALLNVR